MHDLLFEKQSHLELPHLYDSARRLGLDMARFTAELDDDNYLQRVREHQQSGNASGSRHAEIFRERSADGRLVWLEGLVRRG